MRNEVVHWTEQFDLVAPERRLSPLRTIHLSCTSPVNSLQLLVALQTSMTLMAASESESKLDCASLCFDVNSPLSYC